MSCGLIENKLFFGVCVIFWRAFHVLRGLPDGGRKRLTLANSHTCSPGKCTSAHTQCRTQTHACTHTSRFAYLDTYTHTHAETHTEPYIYHTHTHTHARTHMLIGRQTGHSRRRCAVSFFFLPPEPRRGPRREADKDFVMKLLVNLAAPVLSPPRHKAQKSAASPLKPPHHHHPSPQPPYILIKVEWER